MAVVPADLPRGPFRLQPVGARGRCLGSRIAHHDPPSMGAPAKEPVKIERIALRQPSGGCRRAATQPGSLRQTLGGRLPRTRNAQRSALGTQMTGSLVWRPRATASATTVAPTAKGAAVRPSVILVRTNPGRTTWTRTPVPRSDSARPSVYASRPALEAP